MIRAGTTSTGGATTTGGGTTTLGAATTTTGVGTATSPRRPRQPHPRPGKKQPVVVRSVIRQANKIIFFILSSRIGKVPRARTATAITDRHYSQNNFADFVWIDCTVTLRGGPKLRDGVLPGVLEKLMGGRRDAFAKMEKP